MYIFNPFINKMRLWDHVQKSAAHIGFGNFIELSANVTWIPP